MVELDKKYKIGVRRFNINWVGAYTLYIKETLRFLSVFGQTIVGPIVTSILFLLVISLAVGVTRPNVLGVEFIVFLAPCLIAMQIIQQSFSHSSLSDIFFLSVGPHPKQTIFVQLYTVYKVIEEYLLYDYGCFTQLIESVE